MNEEGARMIRNALKDPTIVGSVRATALMWLSIAVQDTTERLQYLEEALHHDPSNGRVQQLMTNLLSDGIDEMVTGTQPTVPPPYTPPDPMPPVVNRTNGTREISLNNIRGTRQLPEVAPGLGPVPEAHFFTTVEIVDGPTGRGSGFFITHDGLMVTTRHAVGNREVITINTGQNRQEQGRVVRSFPMLDLALVKVDIQIKSMMPFSNNTVVPENISLQVTTAQGYVLQGYSRSPHKPLKAGWFRTTMRNLPDAGGSPIKDDRGTVIGMITRAVSPTSGELYGITIGTIRSEAETYLREVQIEPRYNYCPCCGSLSRALMFNGFYCEHCGAVMPSMANIPRAYSAELDVLYHEREGNTCPRCSSRIGRWGGQCLRCGQEF
jgi:S1-C subfamily serine protease